MLAFGQQCMSSEISCFACLWTKHGVIWSIAYSEVFSDDFHVHKVVSWVTSHVSKPKTFPACEICPYAISEAELEICLWPQSILLCTLCANWSLTFWRPSHQESIKHSTSLGLSYCGKHFRLIINKPHITIGIRKHSVNTTIPPQHKQTKGQPFCLPPIKSRLDCGPDP